MQIHFQQIPRRGKPSWKTTLNRTQVKELEPLDLHNRPCGRVGIIAFTSEEQILSLTDSYGARVPRVASSFIGTSPVASRKPLSIYQDGFTRAPRYGRIRAG